MVVVVERLAVVEARQWWRGRAVMWRRRADIVALSSLLRWGCREVGVGLEVVLEGVEVGQRRWGPSVNLWRCERCLIW